MKHIGILTSGGDSPGLNAAIRGVGKTGIHKYGMQVIGFKDGFKGLMENRFLKITSENLSGILTMGGTILGTSRNKPHKMLVGGKVMDMTDVIVENYYKNSLDVLVCLGGGGTQKNAYRLHKSGLNIITMPKTIDNDVYGTDVTFGFDTAMGIAVDAIDRLHSTAHSHHRIILVEIMGHNTGWLALSAGIAGGADVILIPEIPYDAEVVAKSILERKMNGKNFSIVAVAEGSISIDLVLIMNELQAKIENTEENEAKSMYRREMDDLEGIRKGHTYRLAHKLELFTGLESRVTILGHLQRGGTPSAADRLLATRLGTACADFINQGQYGIMVAAKGEGAVGVPLKDIVGKRKSIPEDHPWIASAEAMGICLGR
ncbi:MAG: 6-phosphofructokinase [Bacteroidales bacterium]|nr:6-phosphofructokinase [Bacteroidales bacterium]